ncbi:MAG: DUF3168 domain-containing protein [Brevundimonas sp.]|nr:MAG: DUF3168 domain-containing protein [Brevundimonas sp.]
MSDPANALQDAIEATLRASPALKTAMGQQKVRLYTMSAPNGAPFPYVVIGEDQIIDDSTECADSSEVVTTVHLWARLDDDVSASRKQAKAMAGVIRSALKGAMTVTGFDLVSQEFEDARHLTDPDGLTAHAVVSHRFLLDPA